MAGIKHKIAMYCKRMNLESYWFFKLAVKINFYLFHRNEKRKNQCMGEKNPNKVFYVIRGNGKEVGLCSHFITVTNEIYDAVNRDYIPVVDFRNDRTQYNMPYLINNTWNAWEYYFKPVSAYTLNEVEESKNVIISGTSKNTDKKILIDPADYSKDNIKEVKEWVEKYIAVNDDIVEKVVQKKNELFSDGKILGVFCRGTDYISLRPKGHPVQPGVNQVIEKTKEYLEKYSNIKKIFLATEDYRIYAAFKETFGEKVCVSDLELVKDYDGKDYLCNYLPKNKYETGLNYLIKMLLLAECDYLISSKASGSYFAMIMKKQDWEDSYIYELGVY